MVNILFPMSGNNRFDSEEYLYPKPLIEVQGKPLIEHVLQPFLKLGMKNRFIFLVNRKDCDKFHLDNVLQLITGDNCIILRLEADTKGAACTTLMSIDHIPPEEELIISNSDHFILRDLDLILNDFRSRKLDAGVMCFDSIHPKWSFARTDDAGNVIETAEKRPLSRNAIAGFYYFRMARAYMKGAMRMIEKKAHIDGVYFNSPVLNELILDNAKVGIFAIRNEEYYNFYSPQKIKEYELLSKNGNHNG